MNALPPPCWIKGQPLNPCARRLAESITDGRIDLHGDWAGWRIRAGRLIGPGGISVTPASLRQYARWLASSADAPNAKPLRDRHEPTASSTDTARLNRPEPNGLERTPLAKETPVPTPAAP